MQLFLEKQTVNKLPDDWATRVQLGTFMSVISKKLGGASLDELSRQAKSRFGDSAFVEATKPGWARVTYERKDVLHIHIEPEETWRLLRIPGICIYSKRGEFWIGVKE